jgi:hypothetical protein
MRELTKSTMIRMAVQVVNTVKINMCNNLVEYAKGKRMFRKHVYEGEDIIEIYFVEM